MITPTFVINCSQISDKYFLHIWDKNNFNTVKELYKNETEKSGMRQLRQLHLTVIEHNLPFVTATMHLL
jgi:hypothetical protein